jgi:hypothetical protein
VFDSEAEATYVEFHLDAQRVFRKSLFNLDPYLNDPGRDRRRGLTLIARPSNACRLVFEKTIGELQQLLPGQYFYDPRDFHITTLTLKDAHEGFELSDELLRRYDRCIESTLEDSHAFDVAFRGLAATASTVMFQGHFARNTLNRIRESLRLAISAQNLGADLDARYKTGTAHVVAVRFMKVPEEPWRVFQALERYLDVDFGVTHIDRVYLVLNNWYMSHDKIEVLKAYTLR